MGFLADLKARAVRLYESVEPSVAREVTVLVHDIVAVLEQVVGEKVIEVTPIEVRPVVEEAVKEAEKAASTSSPTPEGK